MPIERKVEYNITLPETLKGMLQITMTFDCQKLREFHRAYKAFGEELDRAVGAVEFTKTPSKRKKEAELYNQVLIWAKQRNRSFTVKDVKDLLGRSESNTSQLLLAMHAAKLIDREHGIGPQYIYNVKPEKIVVQG